MGKKIPLVIGHLQFTSKKEATAYFRSILQSAAFEVELSGSDFADVESLLSCHPDAAEKIGVGIAALYVGPDPYGGRCFHLRRVDESTEHFSFPRCLNGEPPARTRFSNAARLAVQSDIAEFREMVFKDPTLCSEGFVRCAKTGAWVSSTAAHIDHAYPLTFSRIVRDFISARHINLDEFSFYEHTGLYGCVFSDPALVEDFRQYHKQVADLQVVTRESNLQDAWRGRLDLKTNSATEVA